MERPPEDRIEEKLTSHLKKQGKHDQLVGLLKSPAFFKFTGGWEDERVAQKIRRIESRLPENESSRRAAA